MTARTAFVIGATGLIGGAVSRRLLSSGWAVSALARSATAKTRLRDAGAVPVLGDLDTALPEVLDHAAVVDAVVLAAQLDGPTELALVDGLVPRLAGRTLLFVSGSGVLLSLDPPRCGLADGQSCSVRSAGPVLPTGMR